jgi:hypothetical protein
MTAPDVAAKRSLIRVSRSPRVAQCRGWDSNSIPQRQVVLTYYAGGPIYIRLKDEDECFARLPG